MSLLAYVFDANLADDPDVSRTLGVRGDQTLEDLHDVLRKAFGWHGDFPYSFKLDEAELASPLFAEPDARTADVALDQLGLATGREFVHAVDANEEWRIALRLVDVRPAGDEPLPRILERHRETALEPEYELGGGG